MPTKTSPSSGKPRTARSASSSSLSSSPTFFSSICACRIKKNRAPRRAGLPKKENRQKPFHPRETLKDPLAQHLRKAGRPRPPRIGVVRHSPPADRSIVNASRFLTGRAGCAGAYGSARHPSPPHHHFYSFFLCRGAIDCAPISLRPHACSPLVMICTGIEVFTLVGIAVFACYRFYPMVTTFSRVPGPQKFLLNSVAWAGGS